MFQKFFAVITVKKNLHGLDFYFDNTKNIATPKVPRINTRPKSKHTKEE